MTHPAPPLSVTYNGTNYYYATNLQGDVTAILNTSGTAVVQYSYDAWGKLLTTTGSMASDLGVHNPLRYRGYVYDTETGLYYLQSRYYNPYLFRFLNADALVSTGQGMLGNNMFAYCNNNPVNGCDPCGSCFHRWDFWNDCEKCGGKTIRDKWNNVIQWCEDTFDTISSTYEQQVMLETEITRHQNEMIADVGKAMWEAYKHSNELQVQQQYQQDMAVKNHWEDAFSSPARLGDFAAMTFTNGSAYAAYVGLVSAATVSVGSVAFLVATVGFAAWSTARYYNLVPEVSWEDILS